MSTQDPIIQTKICPISGTSFDITQSDMNFYEKISPVFGGKKYTIPTPTLCPAERQRRRLAFRNERTLYKRTCDASGKQIVSMYRPDNGYIVYDQKIRRSDSWDAMDHGRTFDFGRTFTEQFGELTRDVPKMGIMNDDNVTSTNCTYTNDFLYGKNCYMCDSMGECEDCMYSYYCNTSKDLLDCDTVMGNSSNVYECQYGSNLTNCSWLIKSSDCFSCYFGVNLQGCSFCYGCFDLENQTYCIENKQVSKEEYLDFIQHKNDALYKIYFFNQTIIQEHTYMPYIKRSEKCLGDNIFNSNNCTGTSLYTCENVKYTDGCDRITDCQDLFSVWKSSLCYDGITPDNGYQVHFSIYSWGCKYCLYVNNCHNSDYLFGCDGLRNASYCIFNKQYTKEEYETLVSQIIEHMTVTKEWGEFFHPSLSPFGYNETVAMEYYPAHQPSGYHRSTYTPPTPVSDKVIQGIDLPATIDTVQDDILLYAIACEVTGKLFRLQPKELVFYRKHTIPVPRRHPDQRHADRLAMRKG